MSQVGIREYDAKQMFATYTQHIYTGHLITTPEDAGALDPTISRVIKPDQLFGKRGKLGLVGVRLTPSQVADRVRTYSLNTFVMPDGKTDVLDTFVAEPFVAHSHEYYISIKQTRDGDVIYFSLEGGMEVEDNRDAIRSVTIPVLDSTLPVLDDLIAGCQPEHTEAIIQHIQDLFGFYRSHGLVYLEINPFVFDASGQIVNLDMVVKVDTCELYRQSTQWKPIHWVKPFGTTSHPAEDYIESLDAKTGASLKLTIINPQGTIWFLLGGGGASVIAMDTLINAGLGSHIANYGELSGNPDADSNKAYIQTIIDCMIANDAPTQYLCLVGGIANFTNILALAKPLAELIHINAHILIQKNIHIVVRRGGINDIQAQNLIQSTCDQYMIPCTIMSVDKDLCAFIRPVQ